RLPRRIKPHSGLADPDQETPHPRRQHHRSMGNPRPRLQHQAGHRTDGDMGADAGDIHHHEGAVNNIEIAPLHVDHRNTVLDGEWLQRGEYRFGHKYLSQKVFCTSSVLEINLCNPLQIHYIKSMEGGKDNGIHQTGHKFDLQTGAIETIRQSIQSLQDYLGTGDCPNAVHPGAQRKRQDRKALEWATQNKKQIIPEQEFLEKWRRDGKIRGGENRVCFEQDSDGLIWAIKMNELAYHRDDMAAFADRLIKSSEYFP